MAYEKFNNSVNNVKVVIKNVRLTYVHKWQSNTTFSPEIAAIFAG